MGMEQYRIGAHPETDPKSVISGKNYRISVLTEALVRFEYSEDGTFEDRPTQKVPRGGRPFVGAAVALWGQIA